MVGNRLKKEKKWKKEIKMFYLPGTRASQKENHLGVQVGLGEGPFPKAIFCPQSLFKVFMDWCLDHLYWIWRTRIWHWFVLQIFI